MQEDLPTGPASRFDVSPAGAGQRIRLMGAPVEIVTEARAVQTIIDATAEGRGHWTITANLDHLRRYRSEAHARSLIEEADLVVADGMPLIWASRLAGRPLPERVAGSRMVWSISEQASAHGQSLFLLGGAPGVADEAAEILRKHYPGLSIAGTACPPMGFQDEEREMERIRATLTAAAPQIVFVALGFPKQDVLIRRLRGWLPKTSFMGVGISLSYVTGDVSPAPDWICNIGLEWAYRMSQEPTRLVRRYLIDGLPFAMRLMASAGWHRLRHGRMGGSERWGPA
jgi:N-acetylglucosaminyldiphosphoundecaprenol N-acetyl-beta-D-mannosaminyltransferase